VPCCLVVDLDSVWSVKDVVLDCSNKSMPTDRVNAGTSYYSRHGKTQTGKGEAFLFNDYSNQGRQFYVCNMVNF